MVFVNLSIKVSQIPWIPETARPGRQADHLQDENTGCNQEQHHHLKKQKIIMCADNPGVNGCLGTSRAVSGPWVYHSRMSCTVYKEDWRPGQGGQRCSARPLKQTNNNQTKTGVHHCTQLPSSFIKGIHSVLGSSALMTWPFPRSRGSDALFWLPPAPALTCTDKHS